MKTKARVALSTGLLSLFTFLWACSLNAADAAAGSGTKVTAPSSSAPSLVIRVDPRVELMSLIFRLAGNPEYNQGRIESYNAEVEKQFGAYRDHAVVKLARKLRNSRGVSYDACMSLAVFLTDAYELKTIVPLNPWPEGLDNRWTRNDVGKFLEAARKFVKETDFPGFVEQHRALFEETETRLRKLMEKEAHLEWFQEYFGEQSSAAFVLVPALLNGGCCYGARCRIAGGKEELYSMLGVWQADSEGKPEFTSGMVSTVVHEFGHSYANPIIGKHGRELGPAGEELYRHVAEKMRSQAYGNGQTLLCESLVRACEVRYAFRYEGSQAAKQAIGYQKGRGFLWTQELSDLLAEYEAHRDQYPRLGDFAPRLVAFFKEYSRTFGEKYAALQKKRPKVVSMIPENGAKGVDPSLTAIQVVFDRPMRDGSWSLVGNPSRKPESTGKPRYDSARKTWSIPVKLKPEFNYEFMLNSDTYDSFQSEEGVSLEPVRVRFETGKTK